MANFFKILFGGRTKGGVKSFEADQQQEAAYDSVERGIHQVPLDRIVGSVGRYNDFDATFRLKQHLPKERLQKMKQLIREGRSLPPVLLYQIKEEYYALDGNHRIAAAKELQQDTIRAKIVEFIPSKNTLENLRYRQQMAFEEKTGLKQSIKLTEVGQYEHLLNQIRQHHLFLNTQSDIEVSMPDAAADWYATIYRPLKIIIERGHLIENFPDRSIDDLYAYISYSQWELGQSRRYGIGIDRLIPKEMQEFRRKMAATKESEYPDMQRRITAFIVMNVTGRSEFKIVDKLFSLDEVREVHSVHGDIDILVKIELTRDLLSSDSEIIGQFVHRYMRQLPGVISTKTLIPGLSRIKPPVPQG